MELLITGPLKGRVERLKGLAEVSEPYLIFVLGPLLLNEPLKLGKTWFYSKGKGDRLEVLSKSDGIDFMSRVFRTKEGLTFSGLSGYYDPTTAKFTRGEWLKVKGKIDKRHQCALFLEDYLNLKELFLRSGLQRLDLLFLPRYPDRPELKEIVEITRPRYLFFPAPVYSKEKVGDATFVGLEEVASLKGKYLLRL